MPKLDIEMPEVVAPLRTEVDTRPEGAVFLPTTNGSFKIRARPRPQRLLGHFGQYRNALFHAEVEFGLARRWGRVAAVAGQDPSLPALCRGTQ